jgi:acetolactate synthase I/II/III large subunit
VPITRMTGAAALLNGLLGEGVDTIFGLPGGQLDPFFDAMYAAGSRIRYVGARHEQGAAYMAFGYARATGQPAVYAVVPGPGVLNSSAALCTAYACNAPVLCLTGQIPSQSIGRGFGELHELPDQLGILKRLTKWAARVDSAADASPLVARAFQELRSGRPRPVALEMACDVMAVEAEVRDGHSARPRVLPEIDLDSVRRSADVIAAARFPMIYVGGGAVDAAPEVRALAELLNAPVVAFRSGRGIVSDAHPLGLSLPAGHRLWPEVDVVIGIGTRMMEPLRHWGADADLKVVRIDVDAEELTRYGEPTVAIHGDSRQVVQALVAALETRAAKRVAATPRIAEAKAATAAAVEQVQPQVAYLRAIRGALPASGVFCDEITQCGFASWYAFPVSEPRQHINCGYQGTLGYGYATALGVKVARPDVPVVSIAGDGGFLFTLEELATAVQYNIGLKTIVFNSNSFTNVQRQQREWFGGRIIGSDLRNPDFCRVAEAFGAAAYRATTPSDLGATLERALAEPGPALIEVPVGDMASPWKHIMLPRVRGKADAVAAVATTS